MNHINNNSNSFSKKFTNESLDIKKERSINHNLSGLLSIQETLNQKNMTNQDVSTKYFDKKEQINNEISFIQSVKNNFHEIYGLDYSTDKSLLTQINNDLMENRSNIINLIDLNFIKEMKLVPQETCVFVLKIRRAKRLKKTDAALKAQLKNNPHDKDLLIKTGNTSIALKKAQSQIMKYVRGIPKENLQEKTNQLIKREKKLILQQKACISDIEGSKKVTFLGIRRTKSDGIYRYWAMPPEINGNAFTTGGGFKILTHKFSPEEQKKRNALGYQDTVMLTLRSEKVTPCKLDLVSQQKICKILEWCPNTIEQIQTDKGFFAIGMMDDITQKEDICLGSFRGSLEDLKKYHDGGIAHRDLKPGNLLVNETGKIFISDLDTMVLIGEEFPSLSGTRLYFPLEMLLLTDNNKKFEYQKKYVKVCDDHAMLKILMEKVSTPSSTDQNKAKALTRNRLEEDVSKYWTKDDVVFESWIQRFVKPEFREHIKLLFDSPKEYQEEYGDKLHLIDMLNFEADTV